MFEAVGDMSTNMVSKLLPGQVLNSQQSISIIKERHGINSEEFEVPKTHQNVL